MALMVSSRLWLGGVVSPKRDRQLANKLMSLVVQAAAPLGIVLVAVDGWVAYPKAIVRAFRQKVPRGAGQRGRIRLLVWPGLMIGVVVKQRLCHRLVKVSRTVYYGAVGEKRG